MKNRPKPGDELTSNEVCLIELVLLGLSNRQIAKRQGGLSEQTIKNELHTIFIKVGVRRRIQLFPDAEPDD